MGNGLAFLCGHGMGARQEQDPVFIGTDLEKSAMGRQLLCQPCTSLMRDISGIGMQSEAATAEDFAKDGRNVVHVFHRTPAKRATEAILRCICPLPHNQCSFPVSP